MVLNKDGLSFVATRYGTVLLTDKNLRVLHQIPTCMVLHQVSWSGGFNYNFRILWKCMELLQQSYMATTRGLN